MISALGHLGGGMTYPEARSARLTYNALGVLAAGTGILMMVATLWASIDQDPNPFPPFKLLTKLLDLLNGKIYILGWFESLVPDTPGYPPFLNPFYVGGFLLMMLAAYLFRNARRLKEWMDAVKAFMAQESMRESLRPSRTSNRQSIGDVSGSGDININQAIANHFDHRPDSPLTALIIALVAAIVSAFLGPIVGIWLGKG